MSDAAKEAAEVLEAWTGRCEHGAIVCLATTTRLEHRDEAGGWLDDGLAVAKETLTRPIVAGCDACEAVAS